ncbi:RidA family protein [Nonomuraea sp. NPDC048882]|uniref:RidA family protein n=1 Tax=Nonomuraea sp. NPDC048882 TaxID=3154347 RepID=UPI0033C71413
MDVRVPEDEQPPAASTGRSLARRALLAGTAGAATAVTTATAVAAVASTTMPGTAQATGRPYQVINPSDLPAPQGWSHGVVVEARRTLLLGGASGQHRDGTWAVGVVAQYEQTLRNLLSVVRAAGGRPRHLVSLTAYVVDMPQFQAHWDEIQAVWRRLVGPNYPAMAVIGINRLWLPEMLMEIQGTAMLFD